MMDQIEVETVNGTQITLGKDQDGSYYVNGERVGTITNTPLGVILMCAERGYTIRHPDYYRLIALQS